MLFKQFKALLIKEIKLEFRNMYALNGVLLYVVSTVFVCYLSFKHIAEPRAWNSLFWIIMLFASIHAISKSFMQDSKGLLLYYYSIASPGAVILSKITYNVLLMILLSLICYGCYSLFIGNSVINQELFMSSLILGSIGISSILSLISAIAAKANSNFGLMAVLSFPVLMPLILTLIRVSNYAIEGIAFSVVYKYLLVLSLLDLISLTLACLLFPYLWKD